LVVHGDDNAFLTLDKSIVVAGFWTSAQPAGFSDTVQILASGATPGVLMPGESERVPVYYAGLQQPWDFSDTSTDFTIRVIRVDDTTPMNWATEEGNVRPSSISPEAWTPIWNNLVSQMGSTAGSYVSMIDNNAAYLGRLGETVSDVGALLAFEMRQADGLSPLSALSESTDMSVAAPSLPLTFVRFFGSDIVQRYALGPLGRGWSNNWQYMLKQESDGTVNITGPDGSIRTFKPDSRTGGFFAESGDYGVLSAIGSGVFTVRERDGTVTRFRSDGKLDFVEDTNSNRITAGYTVGLLTSLTHSSGQSIHIAYNAAGRIIHVVDSEGHVVDYAYDPSSEHLLSVTDSAGITNYTYESGCGASREHALTSVAHPGEAHQFFNYDDQGRLVATYLDDNIERITFGYDSAGMVSVTNAMNATTKFFFDNRGLLVKIQSPLENTVVGSFDNNFNLTGIIDATGHTTTFAYDKQGNLTRAIDALGHTTQFAYTGPFNRQTSLTDANGNVTRYVYDADGNLLSTTYADGTVERLSYDALGDPLCLVNRRGTPIGYTYDSAGRLTQKSFSDGSQINYTYDARGNLASATDAAGTTTLTYDAADRLTKIAYPNGRFLEFIYDAGGRRAQSVDQDGFTVNYLYDAAGRLAGLRDGSNANIVNYTYDAAGQLTRKDNGNGTYTTYKYDLAGQLLHLVNYAPDGTVNSRFDYTYDHLGQRTSMDTIDGKWTYTYDATGQLIHAVLDSTNPNIADQDLTYVYDSMGNRIRTIENGVTTEYITNNMNQYTTVGTAVCTYDADGNLVRKVDGTEVTCYSYDAENRLIQVETPDGVWTYEYDAFGNRVATSHDGVRVEYLTDPIGLVSVVGEYQGSSGASTRYTYGLGLVSKATASSNPSYYDFDGNGNCAALTGQAGSVLNRYEYDPFGGTLLKTESVSNVFEFVGQLGIMEEGNGLSQMRTRFYDVNAGRFLTPDQIGVSGGFNLYRYVQNNPVKRVDPSGRCSLLGELAIEAAVEGCEWWFGSDELNEGEDEQIQNENNLNKFQSDWDRAKDLVQHKNDIEDLIQRQWQQNGSSHSGGVGKDSDRGQNGSPKSAKSNSVGTNGTTAKSTASYSVVVGYDGEGISGIRPLGAGDDDTCPGKDGGGGSSGTGTSVDPNGKTGPAGVGNMRFVTDDSPLSYRIDFENDALATAPAQQVDITDQLDASLDWKTFELTEIGFGDQVLSVPSGSQHYQTTVEMTYNCETFQIQIEAGLLADIGQVYVRFLSIDPETDLPPNVLVGFLPPEDGTGRGQGHITYVIKPESGLPTGTQVRNVALITFDRGETIATNQVDPHDPTKGTDPTKDCLNTIDAEAPTSSVDSLSNITQSLNINVHWSGSDGAGSGIVAYDIYVSDNGSPYSLWLHNETQDHATFRGVADHTYAFYSIAKDGVGYSEAVPTSPDAQTTIQFFSDPRVADVTVGSISGASEPLQIDVVFTESMAIAPMIADGSILNAVTLYDFTQGTVPLSASDFAYNNTTKTLSILVAGLPEGNYELRLDGSKLLDSTGDPLRGGTDGTISFPVPVFDGAQNLQAGGSNIQVNAYSVPTMADWNSDGLTDLIVGEKTSDELGKVRIYLNQGTNTAPLYNAYSYAQASAGELTVPSSGCLGIFPRVTDWDGDGRKDLIVGLADGRVRFWPNVNTDADPQFGTSSYVQAGDPGAKVDINVGARATVDIVDWNNDGRKDLVVGGLDGKIHIYLNQAASGVPDLGTDSIVQAGSTDLVVPTGRASAAVYDLDADGRKDLVVGNTDGQLLFYHNIGSDTTPAFDVSQTLQAGGAAIDLGAGTRSRPFVGDFNNDGTPDILLGAADGFIRLYLGHPGTSSGPTVGERGETYIYTLQLAYDVTPPEVTQVFVRSSGWSDSFLDALDTSGQGSSTIAHSGYAVSGANQLKTLPWTNLDSLTIVFSEDVNITAENIAIVGVNVLNYTGNFHYDSSTFTATWTFPQALAADKLLLDIQGGTGGVTDKAGNTLAGDFLLRLNVLPGDVNRDEMVVSNDLIKVRNLLSTSPKDAAYSIFMDVNGDGMIISNDLIKVRNLLSTTLPINDPVAPTRSSVAATTIPVAENSVATTSDSTMAEQPIIVSSTSNVASTSVAESIVAATIKKVKAEELAIVSSSLTVAPSQNVSVAEYFGSAMPANNALSMAPLDVTPIVPISSLKGRLTETQAITPSVISVLSNSTKAVSPVAMAVDAILRKSIFTEKVDSPPIITGKQISLDSTDEKKPIKSDSLRTYAKAVSTILADSQLLFHNDLRSSLIQSRTKDSDNLYSSLREDFEDAFEDMFMEITHPTTKTWRRAKY
jgi:RHS repeat-associated protein